ncbi:MAG TPA: LysR family transcriptional regulator [Caulobacteraceae bacterium]
MDRLASITAFVRVIENDGFAAAGRRLNVSKGTLSTQVQALENALGVRLLNRTTRRIGLTDAGREYYERCVQILNDLQEADEAAAEQHGTPRGQLRIYCHENIARLFTPVITEFLTRHPEAAVDLRTGFTMVDLVQERFDLAITPHEATDAILVRRHIGRLSRIACASPRYLEKHPAPRTPADLAGHNCLRHVSNIPAQDEWRFEDPAGELVMARVSGSLITTSVETLYAAAEAGVGLVMACPILIPDLLASRALVPILPDYRVEGVELNAYYPHRRHLSAKVRVFIDLLVAVCREQERSSGVRDC